MKRIAVALTFGMCAVSVRASAEPRATKSARYAKVAAPKLDDAGRTYAELVAAADADGDQRVSENEFESLVRQDVLKQVARRFRRLDRNADGRVFRAEVPTMAPARFQRFDQNGDASFDLVELTNVLIEQALSRCSPVFDRLDHDRDGELSILDADTARPTRVSER